MKSFVGFCFVLLTIGATAQVSVLAPRKAKHGEERTQFFTKDGQHCGLVAKVDGNWYFYLDKSTQNPHGLVSQPFIDETRHGVLVDARQAAIRFALGACKVQGKPVVMK
jgi:hypothetical protein